VAVNRRTVTLAGDAREALRLTVNGTLTPVQQQYVAIAEEATRQLRTLLAKEAEQLAAGQLSLSTIRERERAEAIIRAARTALDRAGAATQTTLTNATTRQVIPLAVDYERAMVASQLPPELRGFGTTINPSTLEAVVQRAAERATYFRDLGPRTIAELEAVLTRGIAIGQNPRVAARQLTAAAERTLNRAGSSALRIMRTEMLDTYRNADLASRLSHDDVLVGWTWYSAGDFNTCASCWAMHGETFPAGMPGPDDHPNGRCIAIPEVRADLALDVPAAPSRDELWSRLSRSQQLGVMGPERLRMLDEGRPWSAFSKQVPEGEWRAYRVATPVSELR
jgi:SPP1 gp7 family putative phage head morphogenesis protein